jgi:8-hydroxy-5-deazaflavin:NADPH oxidoreductase
VRITIVGTGNMARAIASRALAGGHAVTFVGTHISKADDLADEMTGEGPVGSSEEVEGDVVVLAVPYTQAPHAGPPARGRARPAGRGRRHEPGRHQRPRAARHRALRLRCRAHRRRRARRARVVNAFNTTFAGTLLAGAVDGRPLDVFLAGDDEDAKATVAALARDGGLRPIDAGRLARARELEALGYLHMAVQPALGTAFGSAVAIVP